MIINISSDAGVDHYESWGGYGSSKAALDHQTLTWAAEEPDFSWYSLDPGDMRTAMHQAAFPGEDISDRPEPESVAPIVVALIGSGLPSGRYRAADLVDDARGADGVAMSVMLAAQPYTHFSSAEDRTATEPPELRGLRRDGVRLMVASPAGIRHTVFYRLADQLRPGDVLVVNTSATVPGQLDGTLNGSAVVVHVANRLPDGTRVVELRTAPDASAPVLDGRIGGRIGLPAGAVLELIAPYPEPGSSPTGDGNRLWRGRLIGPQQPIELSAGACPTNQLRLPH